MTGTAATASPFGQAANTVQVSAGMLGLGADFTNTYNLVLNGGTLAGAGGGTRTIATASTITLATGKTSVIDLKDAAVGATANMNVSYAGAIGGSGNLAVNATGTGVGKLILAGTNIYIGSTAIHGGTVVVNGGLNGTDSVTVDAGATLASGTGGGFVRTGTTTGNGLDISGTLSPGDTSFAPIHLGLETGTKINFNAGSTLRLDVAAADSSDSVIFVASGDWLAGSGNATLALNGSVDYASTYTVFQNVTTSGFTFGAITGYDNVNYMASFAQSGTDYTLSFAVVPEPDSLLLLSLGSGLALGLRRFRRFRRGTQSF